jgi:alpha-glucuronidase
MKGTSGVKFIKYHEDEGTDDEDRISVNAANRTPVLQTVRFLNNCAGLSDIFLQSNVLIYISILFNCAID